MSAYKHLLAISALPVLLAGCAQLPNVTLNYYLTKTDLRPQVIRTVACTPGDKALVVVNTATVAPKHSADLKTSRSVRLADLKGWLTDSDVQFEWYDDGRLKTINASTTGEGEAVIKTVVTIAAAAAVFALDGGTYKDACDFIRGASDDKNNKSIAITYEGPVDVTKTEKQRIPVDEKSSGLLKNSGLEKYIGGVCAFVGDIVKPALTNFDDSQGGDTVLEWQQPGLVTITLTAGPRDECLDKDKPEKDKPEKSIWTGVVPVAQAGTRYKLPMPKPIWFGKETFGASFNESGALTLAKYSSLAGTGQALNVVGAAVTGAQNEPAQKAAELKAEADRIAQGKRLAECLADRANCK